LLRCDTLGRGQIDVADDDMGAFLCEAGGYRGAET
jgi:hypothetical protein